MWRPECITSRPAGIQSWAGRGAVWTIARGVAGRVGWTRERLSDVGIRGVREVSAAGFVGAAVKRIRKMGGLRVNCEVRS